MEITKFQDWIAVKKLESMASTIVEADHTHYSIEVNYRTTKSELLGGYSKLVLGYVSAALKKNGYHVKHCFSTKPFRLIIGTKNFDDGEWVGCLVYNTDKHKFVMSAGYWNKDRRTVSVNDSMTKTVDEDHASGLVDSLINFMHDLKKRDPRTINKLKPGHLQRGPRK